MANNAHKLTEAHRWFADGIRHDPMTHKVFRIGDRVVVCSRCKLVCKESTWDEMGRCSQCGNEATQAQFVTPRATISIGGTNRPRTTARTTPRRTPAATTTTPPARRSIELVGGRYQTQTPEPPRPRPERRPIVVEPRRESNKDDETLRKVVYYIVLSVAMLALGGLYSAIWLNHFSDMAGHFATLVITLVILGSVNVFSFIHWDEEERIYRSWAYWKDGFLISMGILGGSFVGAYIVVALVFSFFSVPIEIYPPQ